MITIYTDGALKTFSKGKEKRVVLGWGFVAVDSEDNIIKESYGTITEPKEILQTRNIGAELKAVKQGLRWAIKLKVKKVLIVHDFQGCGEWANRVWNSHVPVSKEYSKFIDKARKKIEIGFYLVKGHSGIKWNDYADNLAKKGLK